MQKSILFIADKPDWAYHNIIKTWAELLPEYRCYVAFAKDFFIKPNTFNFIDIIKNKISLFIPKSTKFKIHSSKKYSYPIYTIPPVYEVISNKKEDIIEFDVIVEMAYYFQYISEFPFKASKKIVGLYTDSFPHDGPNFDAKNNIDSRTLSREKFFEQYIQKYDGLVVGSQNLYNDYKNFNFPLVLANGIYKANEFIENPIVGLKEELTIGWTGTPDREMKGFRSIIEPAIQELQNEGLKIRLQTKFSGNYDDLLTFYQDIDLVVIASSADTGPSLFAEASLSAVPSISTKIGFPNMIIKNGENGLFIERDKEQLKEAIRTLYNDRNLLLKFSKSIKNDYLEKLGNQLLVNNFKNFINTI